MTRENNKYDNKSMLVSVLIIIGLATLLHFYWENTKVIIRYILEAQFTYFLIWIVTVVIFIAYYLKLNSKDVVSDTIITKVFGDFIDIALGGIGYATSITTSLTLLKGLFIQNFFTDKQYFSEFNDLDLITVFGISVFLLYYSVKKVIAIAKEGYKANQMEQVLTENKEEVVQDK